MLQKLSWKVGGQQGEGIESTGDILATILNKLGYYLYGYRHFSSRIKGGHTNYKIRVSTTKIRTITNDLTILTAFDQETIDINHHELATSGIILADARFNPQRPDSCQADLITIPFTQLATELGNPIMKNVIAVGMAANMLGISEEICTTVISEVFALKGPSIIATNIKALRLGLNYFAEHYPNLTHNYKLTPADNKQRLFMIGNDAVALGAIAAGCRFMSAYPITPASEIMEYLIRKFPSYGGAVIQTEDEIAACTMAIGANFAGARAFTASSGPGLSLMAEAIGLAGMAEIPLVVVNTQRGGPSTGLPTKQEQSDLMAMIYGTHGEIPKIVMAPSTVEEAFYDTVEAFNLAEEYQCPVILLTDLQLALGKQTAEPFDYEKISQRRGLLILNNDLPPITTPEYYKRFTPTPSGISPRTIPGMENGVHLITGVEHDAMGKPSEQANNRKVQMDKRLHKTDSIFNKFNMPLYLDAPHEQADITLIGFLSTRGAIEEAKETLSAQGLKVNYAHVRLLHPFPAQQLELLLKQTKTVAVIEHNATAQLAQLIRMNVKTDKIIHNILKYDGTIFLPAEIIASCKELI